MVIQLFEGKALVLIEIYGWLRYLEEAFDHALLKCYALMPQV